MLEQLKPIEVNNNGLNSTCQNCGVEIVPYGVGWVSAERTEAPRVCKGLGGKQHEPVENAM